MCCEWTDELWDLSNNQKVHRLELLEQTKQKKKFFQDIKGTTSKVKGPSSTKVRPTPPSKTKTRPSKIIDSMEDNTFFQEVVRSEKKSELNKSKLKSSVVSNPGKQSSCTVSADTKSLKMGQSSVGTKPTKLLSKSNLSMYSIDISLSGNSPAVQTLESGGKRKRKPSSTKKHVKEDMEEEEEKEEKKDMVYGLGSLIIGLLRPFLQVTKWTQLLWGTARTLTLIARGHCVCLPRKARMASPQTMISWEKPTNPHATAAVVDLWPQTRWTQLLWKTAQTLTLIARGHCVCLPRMGIPQTMIRMITWLKPTNPHATAAVVDLGPQTMDPWVPTDLQAMAVRVDPRAVPPYMAMGTLDNQHWLWRPINLLWVRKPAEHHWVLKPTDHHWVWTPTDPQAMTARLGPWITLTIEAGPHHMVHGAAKISS